jgi:hypothetical protein
MTPANQTPTSTTLSTDQLATATGGIFRDPPPLRRRVTHNVAKDEYRRRHLLPWV